MPNLPDKEHRRHRRYDVGDVRGSLVHHLDARVLNMSLTGMAIETNTKLDVGHTYWLRVPHNDDTIRFRSDVKWCKLVRTEVGKDKDILPVYQAGIDFRSVLDERASDILEFIEDNIVVELDRRVFGRFKVGEDSGIALEGDRDFTVLRVSLSGMAIVGDFQPEVDDVFTMEIRPDGGEIDVAGRVVNVIPLDWDDPEQGYKVGVEFQGLTIESRRRLEAFIESLIE